MRSVLRKYPLGLEPGGHFAYRFLRGILSGQVRQFQADVADPRAAQARRLTQIVEASVDTTFGREHNLAAVRNFEDFRNAMPIRTHADLLPWLDRVAQGERGVLTMESPRMLLETSGTTGRPKHIPVTRSWEESVQRAQRLWSLGLAKEQPRMANGKLFSLVSPTTHGESPGGLPIGSNTGRIRSAQPFWVRRRYAVPDAVMGIEDAIVRQYVSLRFGMMADVRAITTANPSLLLLLFRRLNEWREELSQDIRDGTLRCGPASSIPTALREGLERGLRPSDVPHAWTPTERWDLASVNCWKGGPATFFANRLEEALGGVPVRELGVNASEGTFAFPLSQDWPGSVLWVGGHILEFIDSAGEPRWSWELEEGQQYRLVVSTSAGLWRYDMQDIVEVVGACENTPMVRFVGKAGRFLNGVGERVTGAQVSEALKSLGEALVGFTVAVRMGEVPRYVIAFEGKIDGTMLTERLDHGLSELNVEYASKRKSERLGAPEFHALPQGHYARYRSRLVANGAPDGQLKDPILATNAEEWGRVIGGLQGK